MTNNQIALLNMLIYEDIEVNKIASLYIICSVVFENMLSVFKFFDFKCVHSDCQNIE